MAARRTALVSPAGAALLAELRLERRTTPLEQCVLLLCSDGVVRLPRLLAKILSPVLRAVVCGPLAHESRSEYSLREHSVATVEFAIDHCCGDLAKRVGSEDSLALLALADELCLEALRAACSEALIGCLVTTNAAQLQEAAERHNAPELLAAARSITSSGSNALGDLISRKLRLQMQLERNSKLHMEHTAEEDELLKQVRAIEEQRAHEIEQLFRRNGRAEASVEAGYPHPAGKARYVYPNADDGRFWNWSVAKAMDLRSLREEEEVCGTDGAPPAKRPRLTQAAGSRHPTKPGIPAREMFSSIMEAYEAAEPGDVIKLLAGRHMVSTHDRHDKQKWDNVLRKSLQIVADDGLPRSRVVVGIAQGNRETDEGLDGSAIAVVNADVRFANLTLVCAAIYWQTGYVGVRQAGRLWLEGCEMKKFSTMYHAFARGVSVGAGASCFIRKCVIDGAAGAGVEISPRAARVVVESSAITGCAVGDGLDGKGPCRAWYCPGECGAVEIEAWRMLHPDDAYSLDQLTAEVVLRQCQIVGNLGPGVSVRSSREYHVDAVADRISLLDCSVCGNGMAPNVLTSPVGGGGAVVWNKTERGQRYWSVLQEEEEDGESSEHGSDEGESSSSEGEGEGGSESESGDSSSSEGEGETGSESASDDGDGHGSWDEPEGTEAAG
jgi:hypothetical protein